MTRPNPLTLLGLADRIWAIVRNKQLPLPEGAQRELAKDIDLEAYRESGGGMAPDDAPHIADDGKI